ncbi:YaiI/YqxD family protein [Staphylococcus saprophyticus]|uniref:YaiI/YqxD family protein n=1 Tax=Staphylococcus saprophyticus TaxID=29385 RepID=UPI0029767BEB|nr:YaiI/YqxD family protein [Staphylococcus saprophyticus]MDW4230930.1 YaiI/YqxD family protein [Staphylococcus saprophyticus]MDW4245655.1 YaiI/YqxD family protein [Staphylococcus saprophyticus]MDW4257973.1 YaiI/YqxD family protein [Staphylococcus saprophyticus]MDW4260293.1 YaiI/YqxD family protein [Staphylococcus saprophyticus]
MTQVIIDGDACPVTNSIIELTKGTGIFVTVVRSFSHFSTVIQPEHVHIIYVDDGPDAVDYRIVKLVHSDDLVVTQDYGLASLLLNKAKIVMHHKGFIYNQENINTLLEQRHASAQFRKSGGRTKGPAAFAEEDVSKFESIFSNLIHKYFLETED